MSKIRVNFFLPKELYDHIQVIAEQEATTSADLFRKAIKKFIYDYRNEDINVFLEQKRHIQTIASVSGIDEKW
jgi:metal-responsive CopG/Arc/MetJ family transcriptional regulator